MINAFMTNDFYLHMKDLLIQVFYKILWGYFNIFLIIYHPPQKSNQSVQLIQREENQAGYIFIHWATAIRQVLV